MLALVVGAMAFPLVLVFAPVYFPWSMLVLACLGGVVGLSIVAPDARRRSLITVVIAVLMVVTVIAVGILTRNFVLNVGVLTALFAWSVWIFVPVLLGMLLGASLRARFGIVRGAGMGAAATLAVTLVGAGLALLVAPPEVANAPACERELACPRTQCAFMAERRRILAIERVTAFDGKRITCTYTAWGGIHIGQAEMGRGGGSWTDGAWPLIVSGRRH